MTDKNLIIQHVCAKETEIELIKQNLDMINNKLDDIHRHIVGNGRAGLLERVSNLETASKVMYVVVSLAVAAFGVLAVFR